MPILVNDRLKVKRASNETINRMWRGEDSMKKPVKSKPKRVDDTLHGLQDDYALSAIYCELDTMQARIEELEGLVAKINHIEKLAKDAADKASEVETRQMSGEFVRTGHWNKVNIDDSVTGYNTDLFKWLRWK